VRPLLPGSPTCFVLVTSRNRLAGLVARDGARRLAIDVLPPEEALDLLASTVGADRIAREPAAAAELARLCGYLPLALNVAAERVAAHPRHALTDLVAELAAERDRLDVLASEDETATVRTVFSWSYHALKPGDARLFRLLGLHPGTALSVPAAAALAAAGTAPVRVGLERLAAANLLQPAGRDRYRMHDLLRLYAAERAAADEPAAERDAALDRIHCWYLHSTAAATAVLSPMQRRREFGPPPAGCEPLAFDSHEEALRWCDEESGNLLAAIDQAIESGDHAVGCLLPVALWGYSKLRRQWVDWAAVYQRSLVSARALGDRASQAWMLNVLGIAAYDDHRYQAALDWYHESLAIRQETGDRWAQAATLNNMGNALLPLARYAQAEEHFAQALLLWQEVDDRRCIAAATMNLGQVYAADGRARDALDRYQQSLAIRRDIGDRAGEAMVHHNMGEAYFILGELDRALEQFARTVAIVREVGNRWGEANGLAWTAQVLRAAGRPDDARPALRQALEIFEEMGDPDAAEVRAALAELSG
jgi:tetratricopeptide (TPR) repeat protein